MESPSLVNCPIFNRVLDERIKKYQKRIEERRDIFTGEPLCPSIVALLDIDDQFKDPNWTLKNK